MIATTSIVEKHVPATSVYGHVEGQLSRLISRFGLACQRATIMKTYQLICAKSLAIPLASRPPGFSRINEDGTPFQFSIVLGGSKMPLQFLSEVGGAGDCGADRLHASRETLRSIAGLFGAEESLSAVTFIIDEMVPGDNPDLLAEHAGAIWIGASFTPEEEPKLKIYLNAKWGQEVDQWKRLDAFASRFNANAQRYGETQLKNGMKPLGASITISRDPFLSGRVYLGAYGKPMAYYEALARASAGSAFQESFRSYIDTLLGENGRYPTQSTVCSFGFDTSGSYDFKFEMCGLGIFESDADAMVRCSNWLKLQKIDPSIYLCVLDELSSDMLHDSRVHLHSYVGLGARRDRVYSTFYFNPGIWNS